MECIGVGGGGGTEKEGVEGIGGVGGGNERCCGGVDGYGMVISKEAVSSLAHCSLSGVEASSSGAEVDRRTAAVPLFLARTAALLLARDAVRAVLTFLAGRGLALYTWARAAGVSVDVGVVSGRGGVPEEGNMSGGRVEGIVAAVVASPVVGVSEGN